MHTDTGVGETSHLQATISITVSGGHSMLEGTPDPVLLPHVGLPFKATYVFRNASQKQQWAGHLPITVELFFGENESGRDNVSLGRFELKDIPPAPAGPNRIEVMLALDADEILSLSVMDWRTSEYRGMAFAGISGIQPPEIVEGQNPAPSSWVQTLGDQIESVFRSPERRQAGHPCRGSDLCHNLTISLEEALCGLRKTVRAPGAIVCPTCSGTGARPGTAPEHCAVCQGTGWKKEEEETERGPLWKAITCPSCGGHGWVVPHPCQECHGKTWVEIEHSVEVQIPAGIESGAEVLLLHRGTPGRYGGPAGHLRITVTIAEHPFLTRTRSGLSVLLPVSAAFARTGGQLKVPDVERRRSHLLTLPPNTKSGARFPVYEGEGYALTAEIQTYRPSLLSLFPIKRKRLEAIRAALDYSELEVQAHPIGVKATGTTPDGPGQETQLCGALTHAGAGSLGAERESRSYAEFYTRRGERYFHKGDRERALSDYNKAMGFDPDYAPAYNSRSLLFVNQNDPDRALADLDKAVELDPTHAEYFCNRGTVRRFQGALTEALADCDRAVELDPHSANVYVNRASLHVVRNDTANALSDYTRALEVNPDDGKALHRRGDLYCHLKDFTKALADYDKALELDPDDCSVLGDRANIYRLQNDFPRALADIDSVLERNPRRAEAYNNRALIHVLRNDVENALADYNKALELNPKLVPSLNERGRLHLKQGRYAEAIADFEQSLSLHPDEPYACQWLAQAFQGAGNREKAIAYYRKAMDASDSAEMLQETRELLNRLIES
jgi:tetratricopeptide (TPR) repeat protein